MYYKHLGCLISGLLSKVSLNIITHRAPDKASKTFR